MTHWFHRNPLKATGQVDFNLQIFTAHPESIAICGDLRRTRQDLLQLLPDASHSESTVQLALDSYLTLLAGLMTSSQSSSSAAAGDAASAVTSQSGSQLRHALRYRWTHTLLDNKPECRNDAAFELVSILQAVGLWFMKRASRVAAHPDIDMESAKQVHRCLRTAAGLFQTSQELFNSHCAVSPAGTDDRQESVVGGDCDSRVATAYISQCTAEAQEVTIARAIELQHAAGLISALANQTSGMFSAASDALSTVLQHQQRLHQDSGTLRWSLYLQLKADVYRAYAHMYQGESLLADDRCGDAIRSLQESQRCYDAVQRLCAEYSRAHRRGGAAAARPERHLFYRKLAPLLQRTLAKCERENGFIYHQKVPLDPEPLQLRDNTYGLVSPDPYRRPAVSTRWTPVVLASFNNSRLVQPTNSKAARKVEGDLAPVTEVNDPAGSEQHDPNNHSGCCIA